MSPREEVYIQQHEISHEQPVKRRGDRRSPAGTQINGSAKETVARTPSAPHLSGKRKAAVSPQEGVTRRNTAALPPRGEFFPFHSRAVPQILSWNKIRSSEDLLQCLLKFPVCSACLLNTWERQVLPEKARHPKHLLTQQKRCLWADGHVTSWGAGAERIVPIT